MAETWGVEGAREDEDAVVLVASQGWRFDAGSRAEDWRRCLALQTLA